MTHLVDPFGLIAGTWHAIPADGFITYVFAAAVTGVVIALHLLAVLGLLAAVAGLTGHFAEGFRRSFHPQTQKAPASDGDAGA